MAFFQAEFRRKFLYIEKSAAKILLLPGVRGLRTKFLHIDTNAPLKVVFCKENGIASWKNNPWILQA